MTSASHVTDGKEVLDRAVKGTGKGPEVVPGPPGRWLGKMCYVCGSVEGGKTMVPHRQYGDALFCQDCWDRLSTPDTERIAQEVALRGVPL